MTESLSHQGEVDEISADARRERNLIPQGLLALVVVIVIVVVRELFLR
ncbi:hypothetical protein [Microbacterium sp. 179-I 3D3 NHS]